MPKDRVSRQNNTSWFQLHFYGLVAAVIRFDGSSGMICEYACVECNDATRKADTNVYNDLTIDLTRLTLLPIHVVP